MRTAGLAGEIVLMGEPLYTTKQNVAKYLKVIFDEGELRMDESMLDSLDAIPSEAATCKEFLQVRSEAGHAGGNSPGIPDGSVSSEGNCSAIPNSSENWHA